MYMIGEEAQNMMNIPGSTRHGGEGIGRCNLVFSDSGRLPEKQSGINLFMDKYPAYLLQRDRLH